MGRGLRQMPLLALLGLIMAIAMFIPAIHALALDDHRTARIFFYHGVYQTFLWIAVGLAGANWPVRVQGRAQLLTMLGAFTILPLLLAMPLREVVRDTTYVNAVVEMVSSLTTTGATVFDMPDRVPLTLHLWRALVAWLGGMFMWVAAVAILSPLRLGGFEVSMPGGSDGIDRVDLSGRGATLTSGARLWRAARTLVPIYAFLTLNLWLLLLIAGEGATHALIHAMSTLATSGISGMGGVQNGQAGLWGEAAVFGFLIFAVSRQTFAADWKPGHIVHLREDRELRIAAALVVVIPLGLFLRHWTGAFEVDVAGGSTRSLEALWGATFTVLSFLTTTGFESAGWQAARNWSGLATPGILLMGLALFGGGVATTAGGVKLLRVYALYRHGRREMGLLVQPHGVSGVRSEQRRVHPQGVLAAWIFFMMFAMSIALVSLLLAISGLDFETAMVMTVAALSTTGPLLSVAADPVITLGGLGTASKIIFSGAMVLGRLETLAIVALLNPDFWRR